MTLFTEFLNYLAGNRPDVVVTVIAPGKWMSLNDRQHWATKSKATKEWREVTALSCRSQDAPKGLVKIHVTAVFHVHDPNRRRDPHNWAPTFKACVDGMVDYGLVQDDDNKHVVGPDARISETPVPKGKPLFVEYEIRKL